MSPSSTTTLRSQNTSLLLNLIWSNGELSRADLARLSGLSRSTVSAIINPLLEARLLCVVGIGRSSGGRPPTVLRFSGDSFHLIGVEIGAAHVGAMIIDLRGSVKAWRSIEHPVEDNPESTMALVHQQIEEIVASAGVPRASVMGIGIAVPCPVHPDRPNELSSQILPRWRNVRLLDALTARHGWPVFIDNDANMGAIGERWWGSGRNCDTFTYIKVATGVGAGLVIDGDIYRGPNGIAGEIGHTAIDSSGPLCRCGLNGCLETMIGTRSLESQAAALLKGRPDPELGETPDIAQLADAARLGHPLATEVIARGGEYLGVAIANLVNLINPTQVILGGRLASAGDALLIPLRRALQRRAMWSSVLEVDVKVSALGDHAIALGAATRVLQESIADPNRFFLAPRTPHPTGASQPAQPRV